MSTNEVETFLEKNVRKWIVQKSDRFPLREIHWRDYFSTIYERNQNRTCTLSAGGLCSLGLGLIYTVPQKGDSNWAKTVLNQVAELAPPVTSHPLAAALYTEWGRLAQSRGNIKLAEARFRLVIHADPDNIQSRTELGRLLAKLGRDEEAETFLREIIQIDPKNIQSRTELGRLLAKLGRDEEAENFLREVIRIDPKNIQSRTVLAQLYAKAGKTDQARVLYAEVLRLNPGNPYALSGLEGLPRQP